MSSDDLWVVPGAALAAGRGWRIWYSHPGDQSFEPADPQVTRNGRPEPIDTTWKKLDSIREVGRRMGIKTVVLKDPAPGEMYSVSIPELGRRLPFRWRTLSDNLDGDGVAFILSSCYYRNNDKDHALRAATLDLIRTERFAPTFKLLVGDQLYADWPWDLHLSVSESGAKRVYADRYAEYWGDPFFREMLQATPNFVTCDDHEFWNNYPEWQMHLARAATAGQRRRFDAAAHALYALYQSCLNPDERCWYTFDVGRVSFFVTDARSERDRLNSSYPHFFQGSQWRELEAWADGLRGPGVLVLGQPLYLGVGDWKDYTLANYAEDYQRVWALIRRSLAGRNTDGKPHDILVLSGDIHTGRYSKGCVPGADAQYGVPELIASPASMVQPGSTKISRPPDVVYTGAAGTATKVDVAMRPSATLDDNISLVRMQNGTNGRIRFSISIYSIRPFDDRSRWEKFIGQHALGARLLLKDYLEIQLR